VDKLYEEMGFIAYYFHWSHEALMQMEHRERQRWCEEINRINRRLNDDGSEQPENLFDVFGKG
jgi:hypothetical protein